MGIVYTYLAFVKRVIFRYRHMINQYEKLVSEIRGIWIRYMGIGSRIQYTRRVYILIDKMGLEYLGMTI